MQSLRSRDTATTALKRQSVAVSSDSLDPSSSPPTQTRATKASSVRSLDDILRTGETSFLTPSVTLTSEHDHDRDSNTGISNTNHTSTGHHSSSTVLPHPSTLTSPQPRPKMTSRSAEPEYGNTRALSRFLLATGPDLDDELVLEEGGVYSDYREHERLLISLDILML